MSIWDHFGKQSETVIFTEEQGHDGVYRVVSIDAVNAGARTETAKGTDDSGGYGFVGDSAPFATPSDYNPCEINVTLDGNDQCFSEWVK